MTLFGSSARLIRLTTSHALPISVGTSSASPSRVAPWQAVIEPPYFNVTSEISRLQADPARPGLVVEPLLPDPDVDLHEVVRPRLVGPFV